MKSTCIRCGKPTRSTDGIHIHTCTPPKALVLADLLEKAPAHTLEDGTVTLYLGGTVVADRAAAELRRLHDEVEELRYDREDLRKIAAILEAQERFLGSWHSIVKQAFARIDGDEALLRQALDALDCIYSPLHVREINKIAAAIGALQDRLK